MINFACEQNVIRSVTVCARLCMNMRLYVRQWCVYCYTHYGAGRQMTDSSMCTNIMTPCNWYLFCKVYTNNRSTKKVWSWKNFTMWLSTNSLWNSFVLFKPKPKNNYTVFCLHQCSNAVLSQSRRIARCGLGSSAEMFGWCAKH